MRVKDLILLLAIIYSYSAYTQNMVEYTSGWEGKIENSKTFNLKVEIENLGLEKARFKIFNRTNIIDYPFNIKSASLIEIPFSENYYFKGVLSKNGKEINGFIKSGMLLYHLKLTQSDNNTFVGIWNILMVDELKSLNFYLSVENGAGNEYEAYPIFGDNRFTGTWCDNFKKENDSLSFTDFKTGLQFKGKLATNEILLDIYLGNNLLTQIGLTKSTTDWEIGGFKNDNKTSILQLTEMEKLISKDSLPNTHSVLISKKGKIIYENYFDGYNANIPHDMLSASKSISSSIVGIAKDKSLFKNVEQSIFDFLPKKYQIHKDSLKTKIDIQSLLTMSSGIDAIDYGINANPKSSATEQNYQRTPDWIEAILKAPMIHKPNTKANYGSANPALLGVAMDSVISEPLELFIDKFLFQKLGISNYIIQSDLKDKPYFGGGMYLTPKDMLKFGELYLNKGKRKSKRVISKKWVENSFKNYRNLENVVDKNGYGYLWWHNTYQVNEKSIKSIEARGAGGQYIFVIPYLKVVVVVTSGNYRNGKTQQPEAIFKKYILPYLEN
ncbi:serine hydrolase domain-containing protein [Cellulophaga fucicola]|uniref:CubicO group peptidase, beta-lactamase class C family n=1 Tax=Cellulophaga fucicola TaxID=76595 RepID=A0A1K1QK25_9FLAO|nr:serine hydrolase [Cellulophaga fucicola]SFW60125.1 CubicO group peptidase, beta-lactamase class C family [Cellulophaga fucicola]